MHCQGWRDKFQFLYGTIKRHPQRLQEEGFKHFNSSMVQLKGNLTDLLAGELPYFNSSMVQLKDLNLYGCKICFYYFNSSMVQLKVTLVSQFIASVLFQFLYGTIKSLIDSASF